MAADPVRRASGRLAIGPRVGVPRAEIARQSGIARDLAIARRWEIARRAQTARDSGIARGIQLAAKWFARKRLDRSTRRRVRPGQAARNVRAATAVKINGVARAGLGRCAGVADGTSHS
jgi:hypothetical protein